MKKLTIVGTGMGSVKLLTEQAHEIILNSNKIFADERLVEEYKTINKNMIGCTFSKIRDEIENNNEDEVTILVSGDVNFFSASKVLYAQFKDKYEIELINGINSIQYFSTKLKTHYSGAEIISLHGRDAPFIGKICYNEKIFILTGGKFKVQNICKELYSRGLGFVNVSIGENLSYPNERILTGIANDFVNIEFSNLSVMLIENNSAINPHELLTDDDFIRNEKIPMTKEEIRRISIAKLRLMPTDIVYDIGAGTGSVSIEIARCAHDGFVYAIEKEDKAIELVNKNKLKHGAFNLEVIKNIAPEGLEQLPKPDAVFIGGTTGRMEPIFDCIISKNKEVRIVVNAVTIQSLHEAINHFEKNNFNYQVICINCAKLKKVSSYDMFIANNPIYIISGERKCPE